MSKTDSCVKKVSIMGAKDEQQKPCSSEITIKDFFDFMKIAYEVYEHLENNDADQNSKIDWNELTKLTVINHVLDQKERALLSNTVNEDKRLIVSKSDTMVEKDNYIDIDKRHSYSEIEGDSSKLLTKFNLNELCVQWTQSNVKVKLNDVLNEGILDSILPYMVGYKKPNKTTSSTQQPVIKKAHSGEVKKPISFGGFHNNTTPSKDRLGRRKSSVITDRPSVRQENEVEIHVCDEVKGIKKDFKCPQRLLVQNMGYFAEVTSGQRLEDMDISVHCDIQIFDWLMRWVKKDTILVADWPILDPNNVIPILVSASFLQMDPLLQECLTYCHSHMNEIIKTSTNLVCISDNLLTRLAAMYTNVEMEKIKDRKDKIQSRLFCKMILSLNEPVCETLRGHYFTLATMFKCSKCNKLLPLDIAEKIYCVPEAMRIDRRGNIISSHVRDNNWNLTEYIERLSREQRTWRRVYWRLWGDVHHLHCSACDSYFPLNKMEWCCHHSEMAQYFSLDIYRCPLPIGRYPCCGERAYRYQTIDRHSGCRFRLHVPTCNTDQEDAILNIFLRFRDVISLASPNLSFSERLTKLVPRENGAMESRLQCKESFWWEGLRLVPERASLGLLGKLYTSNNKFNPHAKAIQTSQQKLPTNKHNCSALDVDVTEIILHQKGSSGINNSEQNSDSDGLSSSSSDESSPESSSVSSEESKPPSKPIRKRLRKNKTRRRATNAKKEERLWASGVSARGNQDAQRRFEEKNLAVMRAALTRKRPNSSHPTGGVYVKLEAEWRESNCPIATQQVRPRNIFTANNKVNFKTSKVVYK